MSKISKMALFVLISTVLCQAPSSGAQASERLLIFRSPDGGSAGIYSLLPDGSDLKLVTSGSDPAWSPDTKKIAFANQTPSGFHLFVANSDGTGAVQLTSSGSQNRFPKWSPDGTRIAFSSTRDGQEEIYVMNADGSAQTRLTTNAGIDSRPSWSPDGTKVLFASQRARPFTDVHVMNADGSGVVALTSTGAGNDWPVFSPDGTKIAFSSFRFGSANAYELMAMNADGSAQTRLTTNPGNDDSPEWSPDGKKIAFASRQPPETITNKTSIVIMNADGTSPVQVTSKGMDMSISWRRLPSCSASGDGDADESGPVSGPIHEIVEPLAGPLAPFLHQANCSGLAPADL